MKKITHIDPSDTEKPIDLYYWQTSVPVAGYEWTENAFSTAGPVVIDPVLTIARESGSLRRSVPTSSIPPDLHLKFSKLSVSRDAIREFADRYGWLGNGESVRLVNGEVMKGERMASWAHEIAAARLALKLWSSLPNQETGNGGDEKFLETIIEWDSTRANSSVRCVVGVAGGKFLGSKNKAVAERRHWAVPFDESMPFVAFFRPIATRGHLQRFEFARWEREKLVGSFYAPALLLLAELVNERLREFCSPRVMIHSNGRPEGNVVPANMLGYIWLQIYRVITKQLQVRVCIECGEAMDVTKSRSTKKMHDVCATRKRVRRHALRKKGNSDV